MIKNKRVQSIIIFLRLIILSTACSKRVNRYEVVIKNQAHFSTQEFSDAISYITENCNLWMCGNNEHGELGIGNTWKRKKPQWAMDGVLETSLSTGYTFVIRRDHSLCG